MISGGGDGLGLLFRLKLEGHQTACWIRDKRSKQDYDGLLLKKERWEEWIDQETVIIFDSTGGGRIADRLKAAGHFVFAGSSFADQFEIDRQVAFEICSKVGIKIPKTESFYDWESGKTYARSRNDTRLCFKPSGSLSGIMSYLAYDAEDMVEMLDFFSKKGKGQVEYSLQDFVEGVEISTEGWFNGREFMTPFNHTIERKQLMNDNLGPSGGCAGNIVWHLKEVDKIVQEAVLPLEEVLRYNNYIGPWDSNCIVNSEGCWFLEGTPRFGYDAMPAFLETLDQPLGELISSMAREEHPSHLLIKEGFGSALRLTTPPYPSDMMKAEGDLPIRGFKASDRKHLYFYNVKLDEKAQSTTTPAYGNTMTLTGWGQTIHEAMSGPYSLARKARIPNKQYRTDLVDLFFTEFYKLEEVLNANTRNAGDDVDKRSSITTNGKLVSRVEY